MRQLLPGLPRGALKLEGTNAILHIYSSKCTCGNSWTHSELEFIGTNCTSRMLQELYDGAASGEIPVLRTYVYDNPVPKCHGCLTQVPAPKIQPRWPNWHYTIEPERRRVPNAARVAANNQAAANEEINKLLEL